MTPAVPAAVPVTTPVADPRIILLLAVDHTPPGDTLCNITPDPRHILIVPYIAVAGLTVTAVVAMQLAPVDE